MTAPALTPQDAVLDEFLDRYGPHAEEEGPLRFVREILGAEPDPWPKDHPKAGTGEPPPQEQILRALGRRDRRISVSSCHGPGKTTAAAWGILWHLLTCFPQKTAVTAPTEKQLFNALAAEVKKWILRLPPQWQMLIDAQNTTVALKSNPAESFVTYATARAEKPEALQGIHSDYVLLVADEGSAVPDPIYESAIGSMSGTNAITLLLSNPTREKGFFYDTHHKLADMWTRVQISAQDSPRVTPDFIEDVRRRYGENSNAYRVRVLGLFPVTGTDTVINREMIFSAWSREVKGSDIAAEVWGVDPARFGVDRSALAKRRGNIQPEPVQYWGGLDTQQLAALVNAQYQNCPAEKRPAEILVDSIGIGAGVVDRLREMGLPVRGINTSESAPTESQYANLRAELWYRFRDWLCGLDCWMPRDEDFLEQAVTPWYMFTAQNKVQVAAKKDIKAKGFDSPDGADAFVLTFASTAATLANGRKNLKSWNTPLKRGIKGIV